MRALVLLGLVGCTDAAGVTYGAALLVGVERQSVDAATVPTGTQELAIRSTTEAVYPLTLDAGQLHVESDFTRVSADTSLHGEYTARSGHDAILVPLRTAGIPVGEDGTIPIYDIATRPISDSYFGFFEVELRSPNSVQRTKIDVAPFLNPCDTHGEDIKPEAHVLGQPIDRDTHSLQLGPFVIETRVVVVCTPYAS